MTAPATGIDPIVLAEFSNVETRLERLQLAMGGLAELLDGSSGIGPHPSVLAALVDVMADQAQDIASDLDGALQALTFLPADPGED